MPRHQDVGFNKAPSTPRRPAKRKKKKKQGHNKPDACQQRRNQTANNHVWHSLPIKREVFETQIHHHFF